MKKVLIITSEGYLSYIKSYFKHNKKHDTIVINNRNIINEGINTYLNRIVHEVKHNKIIVNGVFGTDDISNVIASIIAKKINIPGPDPVHILRSINKYLSRKIQKEYLQDHYPKFSILSNIDIKRKLQFPLFIKPIYSNSSSNSFFVNSEKKLTKIIRSSKIDLNKRNRIYSKLIKYINDPVSNNYNTNALICENIIKGTQITLDGYIFQGKVHFLGITKSNFIPKTISFSRFDYPIIFKKEINQKLEKIASKFVTSSMLDNTLFNIEFMVDIENDIISIVEINPRMSTQFTPLVKMITGISQLEIACDISIGIKPNFKLDISNNNNIASCCIFRRSKDAKVLKCPTKKELDILKKRFPCSSIVSRVSKGKKLSDYRQDTFTYRYGYAYIPGSNTKEIMAKYTEIKKYLNFKFENI